MPPSLSTPSAPSPSHEALAAWGTVILVVATVLLGALLPARPGTQVRSVAEDPGCLAWSGRPGLLAAGERLHPGGAARPAPRRRVSGAAPVFRFAPSPNGRLHLGHAYSALLNADLAARMGGVCRLRIEDIDPLRSTPELIAALFSDLAWLGLGYPEPVRYQSGHMAAYRGALHRLARDGLVYPCFCSRGEIQVRVEREGSARDPDGAPLYPGTCRGLDRSASMARRERGAPHRWRLDMSRALAAAAGPHGYGAFDDAGERRVSADPARWGDAVLARRDVPTSYHLAVVQDDAAEGVTHVVRGQDLEAATDLHVLLQRLLGLPSPRYRHHALIRDARGSKLSKSRGSTALADLRGAGTTPAEIRRRLGFR